MKYRTRMALYFCIIILMIAVGLGTINYWNSRQMVMQNARLRADDTLLQLKNTNDLLLENLGQSLKAFSSYPELELFASNYNMITDYKAKQAVFDRVSGILNMNQYFTSCYVYYPSQKTVIDVNTYTSSYKPLSACSNFRLIEMAAAEYEKGKDVPGNNMFCVTLAGGGKEWGMVVPVRYSSQIVEPPLLIVTVDGSYFFQSLKTVENSRKAEVYIANNELIWIDRQPEEDILSRFKEESAGEESGNFVCRKEDGNYMAAYMVSGESGWSYIYMVPLDSAYEKITVLAFTSGAAVLLCALAGILVSGYLSGRLYKPIDALFRQLKNNEQIVRNSFLKQLLENELELYDSVYENFSLYHIDFKENMRYTVAVLTAEWEGERLPAQTAHQEQLRLLGGMEQAVRAAISKQEPGIHVEIVKMNERELALVIGLDEERADKDAIELLLAGILDRTEHTGNCNAAIGYSVSSLDAAKIPFLYKQAKSALEYQFILTDSRIIGFSELPSNVADSCRYPWNTEKVILSALRQGLSEEVKTGLEDFSSFLLEHVKNVEQIRLMFAHLCTDILQAAEEMRWGDAPEALPADLYNEIMTSASISDIVAYLKHFCEALCEEARLKKTGRENKIAAAAAAYLDKNFASSNMDLEQLSVEVGFSVSYISKMFKAYTGIPVKEYITQKRIAMASELLLNTGKKVWEVGEAVGYDQQRSFIEIFKKYRGMTPSEYRREGKKADEAQK